MVMVIVMVRLMVMIENRDKLEHLSSPSPGEHDPDDDQ